MEFLIISNKVGCALRTDRSNGAQGRTLHRIMLAFLTSFWASAVFSRHRG